MKSSALLAGRLYAGLHVLGSGLPDGVVFAADTTSPEVSSIASHLAVRLAIPFQVALSPDAVAAAVATLRANGARRVAIAAYVERGTSYDTLLAAGADHVTEPFGTRAAAAA
ncbi:hypothetical protein [Tenggerimyces flavus]|uniref:Uncharacterized protein n=1 Tax=Tenggerimyces flavus TaxID=1708749 RepID=A0ABV7YNH7_9ACTN|nr:hypothetical protein [Tenggerimyces flavus]MBM7785749.1 hypothetical protein [Tenggerimyces flavus]